MLRRFMRKAIGVMRRNPRFNEWWMTNRETLRFPLYLAAMVAGARGSYLCDCTACGHHGRFRAVDIPPRFNARCPRCSSSERQRLLALYLRQNPDVGRGRVIHLAPEPAIAALLVPRAADYRTADLFMPGVDLRLDLQSIALGDASVDLFLCSHVLEHVPDDARALAELFRCTAPGGQVLIMVPIVEGWPATYENEDAANADDATRTLHFGQFDHVRMYGADLRDRIRGAGFDLDEFRGAADDCIRYGLLRGETVFVATRA